MIVFQLERIWHLGVHNKLSYEASKRVVLSNKIYCLWVALVIPQVVIYMYLDILVISFIAAFATVSFLFSLYLNHKRRYLFSKILYVLSCAIPIYLCSAMLGPDSGV